MMFKKIIFFLLILFSSTAPLFAEQPDVDKNIIIALDSSASVTSVDFIKQRDAFVNLFSNISIDSVTSGNYGAWAISFVLWDTVSITNPVRYFIIRNQQDLDGLVSIISELDKNDLGATNISDALIASFEVVDSYQGNSAERIIIITGDGVANSGLSPDTVGQEISLFNKIEIYALVFESIIEDVPLFFEQNVIFGVGSRVFLIEEWDNLIPVLEN